MKNIFIRKFTAVVVECCVHLHPIFIASLDLSLSFFFFVAVDCKCHKFLSADGKNVPNISKA